MYVTSAPSEKIHQGSAVASHPAVCAPPLHATSPMQPLWGFALPQLAETNSPHPSPVWGTLRNQRHPHSEAELCFLLWAEAFQTVSNLCLTWGQILQLCARIASKKGDTFESFPCITTFSGTQVFCIRSREDHFLKGTTSHLSWEIHSLIQLKRTRYD